MDSVFEWQMFLPNSPRSPSTQLEAEKGPEVELSVAVAESFRSEERVGSEGGGNDGGGDGGADGGGKGDGGGDGGCSRGLPHQSGWLRAIGQSVVWLI